MKINNVSFVGLGVMGYPMAGFLKKNNFSVTVYNRTQLKAEKWSIEHGDKYATTPGKAVINSDARYIGLIGSRRKIKLIFDDLIELGVSTERLNQVYAPIGLDISSKTVSEIAVSIISQLIQVRNSHQAKGNIGHQPKPMPTIQIDS